MLKTVVNAGFGKRVAAAMKGYNAILIYDSSGGKILFCHRQKDPYKGKYNFVGGKIEPDEEGFAAAYRELFEETGISREDVSLSHLMDLTYYGPDFYLEIYAGKLGHPVKLIEEKNPLVWFSGTEDFFDTQKFAGDGNIGHIIRIAKRYGFGVSQKNMEMLRTSRACIGIDGCRGGWIAAILEQGNLCVEKYDSVDAIIEKHPGFSQCLIDMVVGLQEKKTDIRPDDYARRLLSGRSSSVFPSPCRQAVYEPDISEKYRLNQQILGKKFTPLTLGIMPKIKQVDEFLDRNPGYKNVILESHPEVCFSRLNGRTVMSRKATAEGFEERIEILSRYAEIDRTYLMAKQKEFGCNPDDILDAVCLAVTACLADYGKTEVIPPSPMQDARGLYMQMVIPERPE